MPERVDDGWTVATPSAVGLDDARLAGLDALLKQWPKRNVHAVVNAFDHRHSIPTALLNRFVLPAVMDDPPCAT